MKPICLIVIILICGEITSSYSIGLDSHGVQLGENYSKLLLLGTLIIWTLPPSAISLKNATTTLKQENPNRESRQAPIGSTSIKNGRRKKISKVKVSVETETDMNDNDSIINVKTPQIQKTRPQKQQPQKDIVVTVRDKESPRDELDPMVCFPKALCGVSSEVAQISNRRKNGLITDYLLLMRAIARNPDVVHKVLSAKEKGVTLPSSTEESQNDNVQDDKEESAEEDETSASEEEQNEEKPQTNDDKEESDEEEEDDDDEEDEEPEEDDQPVEIRKTKKKEKIPKNAKEFDQYNLEEKYNMEQLFKETVQEESESDNWWNFGDTPTTKTKPSWWRSQPAPTFGAESYSSESGQQQQKGSRRPYSRAETFPRPRPTYGRYSESSFEGPYRGSEPFAMPPSSGHHGAPTFGGYNGYRPSTSAPYYDYADQQEEYPQPFTRSEPYFDSPPSSYGSLEPTAISTNNQGTSSGGVTSFVSKLFGFGSSGGMFGSDPFFSGMSRGLSSSAEVEPGVGVSQTKEILETAIEIGKEFDQPSKCNEIFNACKFEYTELLYMIDDLRQNLRRKVRNGNDDKKGKKSTTGKSSLKSKTKDKKIKAKTSLTKSSTRSKAKQKKSKQKASSGSKVPKTKKTQTKSRLPLSSNESPERYVIPLKDDRYPRPQAYGDQQGQPSIPAFSFSNMFSWLGLSN